MPSTVATSQIILTQTQFISAPSPSIDIIEIMVIEDLAFRLSISTSEIYLQSIEEIQWPNTGLGCPNPFLDYADVIVPGYLIILTTDEVAFYYHADRNNHFILCDEQNRPQFPLIPVTPGEIKDGNPWMPVDPVD